MTRQHKRRHRRADKSSSSLSLSDQSSDHENKQSMISNITNETKSIADAKLKLNENRCKILKEMGIDDCNERNARISVSDNAEILRETVIEHKIQIPCKAVVKETVMKEVSFEETELVSEEIIETEKIPQRVITLQRPSQIDHEKVHIVEEVVEVPEIVVRKNFIEKKVPKIIQRVVEVPDDEIAEITKEVDIDEVEYVDKVVHLEEEYIQYVDVEVPEIVEVPNYIEIAEEKYTTKDYINKINHNTPKPIELEHVIQYECPRLKPVYHDETYVLNVPRIIQVPVYEDFLPEHNLETLYILKDRFDEMARMQSPVAMCFAEDYAVQAKDTFHTVKMPHSDIETEHPEIHHVPCHVPELEPTKEIHPYDHSLTSSSTSSVRSSSSPIEGTISSAHLRPTQPATKQRRGCCVAPRKGSVHSLAPPSVSHHTNVSRKTSVSKAPVTVQRATSNIHRVPRSASNADVAMTSVPHTYHSQHTEHDFTPHITETHIGEVIEKRSVDTNYVQQFVTNADPLNRHPPSHILAATELPSGRRSVSVDQRSVSQPLTHRTVSHEISHSHHTPSRQTTTTSAPLKESIQPRPSVSHQSIRISHEPQRSTSHTNSIHVDDASLYCEGAATRSAYQPRIHKNGQILIHPPAPKTSIRAGSNQI